MVEGQLNHRDSMGHAEVLRAGEVQRMSAGSGIVHSEINEGDGPCRLLQIWIEPSSSGIAPDYEQKPFAISAGWTLLLDPQRRDGAMAIARPVRLWRAQPSAGTCLPLELPADGQAWLQLISGNGQLGSSEPADPLPLVQGDGVGFRPSPGQAEPAWFETGALGADLLLFELR
jgi:redox-sensitive bicupin YhaK (pirin superfamily)